MVLPAQGLPMTVTADVPCRRCENCLRRRAAHWRLRALSEGSYAARTWFSTLTFNPEARFECLTRARTGRTRVSLGEQGVDYDALDETERFRLYERETYAHVRGWLKRVRKHNPAFRYLLVVERHKSGDPHYHVLVHESDPDQPLRKRLLSSQWRSGFSQFKLVENRSQLTYSTKYLTKDFAARVRASQNYGTPVPLPSDEAFPRMDRQSTF